MVADHHAAVTNERKSNVLSSGTNIQSCGTNCGKLAILLNDDNIDSDKFMFGLIYCFNYCSPKSGMQYNTVLTENLKNHLVSDCHVATKLIGMLLHLLLMAGQQESTLTAIGDQAPSSFMGKLQPFLNSHTSRGKRRVTFVISLDAEFCFHYVPYGT